MYESIYLTHYALPMHILERSTNYTSVMRINEKGIKKNNLKIFPSDMN